jgi:hypothetical protein
MTSFFATSSIPMRISDQFGRPLVGGRVFPLESHAAIPAAGTFEAIGERNDDAWILVKFQGRYGLIPMSALNLDAERRE